MMSPAVQFKVSANFCCEPNRLSIAISLCHYFFFIAAPAPPVTIEDFKSKWEALTRQKGDSIPLGSLTDGLSIPKQEESLGNDPRRNRGGIAGNRSDITSSSDSSIDFGGFDIVQVLRLMCQCEDQLSFFAPKVLEYFKKVFLIYASKLVQQK
jgi:hypothetical protein